MNLPKSLVKDIFKQLKEFRPYAAFSKLYQYFVANFLIDKSKREQVFRIFIEFDPECMGYITKQSFEAALTRNNVKFEKEDISIVFESLDANRDGKITFMDFCMGAIKK